ncbi:MAG: hypothetical protein WC683_06795 [bacterium]
MATNWVPQRSGAFDTLSGNAASPWHDGGAQTALNSYPYKDDAADTFSTGAFAISAPSVAVTGTGAGGIGAGGSLETGAEAFTMGVLTGTTTGGLTTGAGRFNCTSFAQGAGATWNIGSGGIGITANSTFAGRMNYAPGTNGGCQANANSTVSITGAAASAIYAIGTAWTAGNFCTFTNTNAGANARLTFAEITYGYFSYSHILVGYPCFKCENAGRNIILILNACDVENKISNCFLFNNYSRVFCVVRDSFISSVTSGSGVNIAAGGMARMTFTNCVFGTDVDGNVQANTTDIATSIGVRLVADGISLSAATPISGLGAVVADNYGRANGVGTSGIGYLYDGMVGTVERSTAAPYGAETYHARQTPASTVTAVLPLDMHCEVPVITGDKSVAVSVPAARSGMTSDCAKVIIDPEQAWVTSVQSTELLTDAGTLITAPYTLTATSGVVGGTAAKGKIRIVFRTDEYESAKVVDWGKATIVVTHADDTTTTYYVSHQNWANGMPTVDAPTYVAPANIKNAVPSDFGDGTYSPDFPAVGNVLSTDTVDGSNGTLTLPANGTKVLVAEAAFGVAGNSITPAATIPAGANVQAAAAAYGINGNSETPSYPTTATSQAAQLATDQAAVDAGKADILTTRTILGVVGTRDLTLYALISGIVAAGDVRNGTPRYTGGSNGTWDAVSKSDVVDAAFVATGNKNYVGGADGSYPTTATTEAAQLATDQAAVDAKKTYLDSTQTILGVTGTLNMALYSLISNIVSAAFVAVGNNNYVGGSPGAYPTTATSQAAQLVTDQAAVDAQKANILDTATILGVDGTYDTTPAAPARPTLAVVNSGSGTSVTATVAGAAGVTNLLFYRLDGASSWTTGNTRVGDGIITQTGLTALRRYEFIAVSESTGAYSLPSVPATLVPRNTSGSGTHTEAQIFSPVPSPEAQGKARFWINANTKRIEISVVSSNARPLVLNSAEFTATATRRTM